VVVVIATTAASCGPSAEKSDGGSDAGKPDAGPLCPPGCAVLVRDGGAVFSEDGGAYCLC